MEAVYSWVKHIIYYVIFLSIVSNLLADTKYEKYVRFFAGMVLILLTAGPIVNGLGLEEQIAASFKQLSFQQEAGDLNQNLLGMEDKRLEQIMAKYEEAVEEDVARIAKEQGVECVAAQADIERDRASSRYGQVVGLRLMVKRGTEEEEKQQDALQAKSVQVNIGNVRDVNVELEKVRGTGDSAAEPGSASPAPSALAPGLVSPTPSASVHGPASLEP